MSAASKQSGEPRLGSPLAEEEEEDLYVRLKALRRQLELVEIREECIKNKHKNLKRELRWEVKRLQSVPLVVGHLLEMIDQNSAIVRSSRRSNRYVRILSTVNRELHLFVKPDISGCDIQKQEIREFVELPLIHHELYRQIGIDPPRGVLLCGPPGTGKTMFAKALAHHTTATFIRVVGSEVLGSPFEKFHTGARMARMFFCPAKENTPSIVFMDEVDAIAADREVQRILLELLNRSRYRMPDSPVCRSRHEISMELAGPSSAFLLASPGPRVLPKFIRATLIGTYVIFPVNGR
ncbi:unnamed protein product [Spirodela intermedia]|uniref:AAA+ ATPase domain-containing protein n=1 Tax=Spirodela intermedia TaxID=51605 RepID=A0A7I8IWS4_SPIIN|nr:unnamed protein product [Spirodela intermedia]CAA6662231.1 unnamed protein product [Spirodela intermedia]